ncbi:GDP-mannose-dependent alpha-(1-6)-phosphatidylinositol monomannoside mannosyltransferase [Variovorax sp. SRS16]|uniref:glycosyltransferase family 4 protein n=1 Tax=Variovorax sp. SRS16 TaxID=282217 RepID=UPI0013185A35|nr:glycosyltransferase family 4 protein [Variovorax sp. SRS16]VTU19473.1 GDP-mannose-dependent alpha-(1-6)-phosphatidylinositol monomannoside mannosyltransferase [Variovorax sp. SRS16]
MKILLYSHVFHPSTGGVETVSIELAQGFARSGIECKVLTRTPREPGRAFPFEVIDNPDGKRSRELVRWADVVLFNGATLSLTPWVLLYRKPFVWVHTAYQAACIDGAGWYDGARAPLTPLASVRHHAALRGWKHVVRDALKLGLRRFVATWLVTKHVAITDWMQQANPLPRQVRIYNPFPTERFEAASGATQAPEFDFLYLGRLVSEKGVDTLVKAFATVVSQRLNAPPRLVIIGDGERRAELEALAERLDVASSIVFAGNQHGAALVDWVSKGRIAVVPSVWCEPMGGVVVEMMAAGRNLIVSERGGLAECMGDAGLVFANGDDEALARRMLQLLDDPALQAVQSARAKERALEFAPGPLVEQYIRMLAEIAGPRTPHG